MIRNFCWLLWGTFILLACSKPALQVVDWNPKHPKAGEKITIRFNPQRLLRSDQQDIKIFMVYQLLKDRQVETFRLPMIAKKHFWKVTIRTESQNYLIRLKFEDQLDRVEDNNGCGWNIIIRNDRGEIARNTHYKLGIILSQEKTAGAVPDFSTASNEFEQELKLYPDNYQAWFDTWSIKLKEANFSTQQLDQVASELNHLLTNSRPDPELFALTYNTYWKLLNDPNSAIRYGERLLSTYPDYPKKDEVAYSLIFLKNKGRQTAIDAELIRFISQANDPIFLKNAYYHLGFSFQQSQIAGNAILFFRKYLAIEPTDIQVRLNLANLYIKGREYQLAQQMIDQARLNCTEENYFQINPWQEPLPRQQWLRVDHCQILSTQATLETARQNFSSAIQNRKQVIMLGTPFPAFEWVKIGDIYFQMDKLDSAEYAYIKALSISAGQEDAIKKVLMIYQAKNQNLEKFTNYLQNAIQEELRASAKLGPDFVLSDLNGTVFKLSDQKGKIVLLTFWDSWSSACKQEIPQLNELVNKFNQNPRIVLWAISVEAPISIHKFLNDTPFQFQHFHSGYEVKKLFNVIGFPTHVLIDQNGKIRYTHIGYAPDIALQLQKEIELLLQEGEIIS